MAITKDQIKAVTTQPGTFTVPNPGLSKTEMSSFRSRVWQSAKRNGLKASCSLKDGSFVIVVTQG